MASITDLSADELLTDTIQFVVDALGVCDYATCSALRWHGEPEKLRCCECGGNDPSYTVTGWIETSFAADGRLRETSSLDCPTLDATVIGLSVARCWPNPPVATKQDDPRDLVAAELASVLDCLRGSFVHCEQNPMSFLGGCSKMVLGRFVSRRAKGETPYGEAGKLEWQCAGWVFTVTVA